MFQLSGFYCKQQELLGPTLSSTPWPGLQSSRASRARHFLSVGLAWPAKMPSSGRAVQAVSFSYFRMV